MTGLLSFRVWQMLSKEKAMKPIPMTKTYLKYGFVITEYECQHCPRCSGIINAGSNFQPKYCNQCGQKLDFSKVEWKEEKELGFADRRRVDEQVEN